MRGKVGTFRRFEKAPKPLDSRSEAAHKPRRHNQRSAPPRRPKRRPKRREPPMDDTVRRDHAPRTSTPASTGAAPCPRSASWGSISRSASTTAGSTATACRGCKQALENSELGALLVFDVNNIRYITSTKIGEWERDKLSRWALLTRTGEPILWDFGSAAVHHKLYTPWLEPENCKAGLVGLRGTVRSRLRTDEAARRGDRLAHARSRRCRHADRRRHHRAADDVRIGEGRAQGPRRPAGDAGGARDQMRRRDRAA